MGAKLDVDEVIAFLKQHKTNLRCGDVKKQLMALGFDVRDADGGHKVFQHTGLPSFNSGSFNCGHGKNPEIKTIYISKIIRWLTEYRDELNLYLGEHDD